MKKFFIKIFIPISVTFLININAMEEQQNKQTEHYIPALKILKYHTTANAIEALSHPIFGQYPELDVYPKIEQLNGSNYSKIREEIDEQLRNIPQEFRSHIIFASIIKNDQNIKNQYYNKELSSTDNWITPLLILKAGYQSETLKEIKDAYKLLDDNKHCWEKHPKNLGIIKNNWITKFRKKKNCS